ncbi:hypothetical protein PIB30_026203, partial [Stylosanthes scabra]|nr:hypothetical protein [Stylosanthes scabra]
NTIGGKSKETEYVEAVDRQNSEEARELEIETVHKSRKTCHHQGGHQQSTYVLHGAI